MAFLGNEILEVDLPNLITPFNEKNLESAHYELTLGNEAYLTDSTSGSKDILTDDNSIVSIEPGQFALLLTNETVKVPNEKIAFISIKASLKFKGLVNISGFHVDPGFEGKLIFSVFNAGPSRILLEQGQKCFLIWYSNLEGTADYDGKHNGQSKIPLNHIQGLSGKLASPNVLLGRVNKIDGSLIRHWWAILFILATCVGLCTRFYWQKSEYEKGFDNGYNKQEIENKVNKKVDLIINKKMDSIINAKFDKIKLVKDTIQK